MQFGIMFFSSDADASSSYGNMMQIARYADSNDYSSIWTPERHFTKFGGIFPNPVVTSATIAAITKKIKIRAGSVVSPLHHVIRIVEDWSMLDNLSNGRVAISLASGWNINDFVFFPERYEGRNELIEEQIVEIRRLWKERKMTFRNSFGIEVDIEIWPKPFQAELPIWISAKGNPKSFIRAGKLGANILTHLVEQELNDLKENIQLYRKIFLEHHPSKQPIVSLMLHTYIDNNNDVSSVVKQPLTAYLNTIIDNGGLSSDVVNRKKYILSQSYKDELVELSFKRLISKASLIGNTETCRNYIDNLKIIGVDEIISLLDYGLGLSEIFISLENLTYLKTEYYEHYTN